MLTDRDPLIIYQFENPFPRMRKNISKRKENLSFTHKIMRDTMRVGKSVLTNGNRRVSAGYLPVIIRPFEKRDILLRGMASLRPSVNFFVSG